MSDLFTNVEGFGEPVLFIHGSAANHTTWSMQLVPLRKKLRLILYDRRGTGSSPPTPRHYAIEDHADDAAQLLREHGAGRPLVVVGSSMGGVVALDLLRRYPELVKGAMILEPPLADKDGATLLDGGFLQRFDEIAARDGGEAAGEFFLRSVLGDEAFEKMPKVFRERSRAMYAAIREDCIALGDYRVRFDTLHEVKKPALLMGGEHSSPLYRPVLEALARNLANAKLEILSGVGHMMHAEGYRRFNARLVEFLSSPPG